MKRIGLTGGIGMGKSTATRGFRRARVRVHSSIPDDVLRAAHLEPCPDIAAAVSAELAARGSDARVAVLPHGPLTIPYLAA